MTNRAKPPDINSLPDQTVYGRQELLADAREFCRSRRYLLDFVPSNKVLLGQIETALHSLDQPDLEKLHPITFFAMFGRNVDGKTGLHVFSMNTRRETDQVVLIVRGIGNTQVTVTCIRDIQEKDPEYSNVHYFDIRLLPWEDFVSLATRTSNGNLEIKVAANSDVPICGDTAVFACAGVRDRSGRLSNFVPLDRVDLNTPRIRDEGARDDVNDNGIRTPAPAATATSPAGPTTTSTSTPPSAGRP